jgi:hypothetical protein
MTTTPRSRSSARLALLAAAALLASASAVLADQIVYFVNGKAIMVKSVERGERFTILEIEGGGRMGVPTEQIARIEEYQVSAPVVQAPAPTAPQMPIVATSVPAPPAAQAARPPGAAPPPPQALGPGMGGAPQAPGQGVSGLTPLSLGGAAGQAYQSPRPAPLNRDRPQAGPGGAVLQAPGMQQRPGVAGAGGRRGGRAGLGRRLGGPYLPPQAQAKPNAPAPAPPPATSAGDAEPDEEAPDEDAGAAAEAPEEPESGSEPQPPAGEPQGPGASS